MGRPTSGRSRPPKESAAEARERDMAKAAGDLDRAWPTGARPLPYAMRKSDLLTLSGWTVLCRKSSGREVAFATYSTRAEAVRVASYLDAIGCPTRVVDPDAAAPAMDEGADA